MSLSRHELIQALEAHFRHLTLTLYDTSVSPETLEEEVGPYLDEKVRFVDPWQTASGRDKYRLGAAGFHRMFDFDLELFQVNVQLERSGMRGRALLDGVMNLRQLSRSHPFPLRTLLVYEFVLVDPPTSAQDVRFLIQTHEEMWSFGDMLAALPVSGWIYRKLFRPGFSHAFLAASALSRRLRRASPGP